jgi:hypothetical protein
LPAIRGFPSPFLSLLRRAANTEELSPLSQAYLSLSFARRNGKRKIMEIEKECHEENEEEEGENIKPCAQ